MNDDALDLKTETQSDGRRTFLQNVGISSFLTALGAFSANGQASAGLISLTPPFQTHVSNITSTTSSDGREDSFQIDATGSNGAKTSTSAFQKRVDYGSAYVIIDQIATNYYASGVDQPGGTSTLTSIMLGTKGPVEGNIRHDNMDVFYILDGKTLKRSQTTVNVKLDKPQNQSSMDELLQQIISSKLSKQGGPK